MNVLFINWYTESEIAMWRLVWGCQCAKGKVRCTFLWPLGRSEKELWTSYGRKYCDLDISVPVRTWLAVEMAHRG